MATTHRKNPYTLSELGDLIGRLRHEPTPPEDLEVRRKLAAESNRALCAMDPIPLPIEDLILQAREDSVS